MDLHLHVQRIDLFFRERNRRLGCWGVRPNWSLTSCEQIGCLLEPVHLRSGKAIEMRSACFIRHVLNYTRKTGHEKKSRRRMQERTGEIGLRLCCVYKTNHSVHP